MTDQLTDLVAQVRTAVAEQTPLRIAGSGSKHDWLPDHESSHGHNQTLSLSAHTGVVSYAPTELVITVRAGTTIAELQAILAEQGQILPSDPPQYDGRATVGGTLAANLSGSPRPWAGSTRDQVLGLNLINGAGEHLRFGGQVIKNVAGFDASRLQAGAMGWLGVITEVSFKVAPKPLHQQSYRCEASAEQAQLLMRQIAQLPLPISGFRWIAGACWLRLDGEPTVLAALATTLPSIPGGANSSWQAVDDEEAAAFWLVARELRAQHDVRKTSLWRLSLPSTAPLYPDMSAAPLSVIDWAGAEQWFTGEYDWASVETFARTHGGEATRWDANGKRVSAKSAAYQHILTALKQQLDPAGIFNLGVEQIWSNDAR